MKRLAGLLCAFSLILPVGAFGEPDFGPGNSSKGPQAPGAICHPPGQTTDFPACK